ncbi:MAG: hypothetical protein ABIB43_06970 [archaeon]
MKHECSKSFGWLVLIVGIFYLLYNVGIGWMQWLDKIHWFTTVLLLVGLYKVAKK